MADYVPFCRKKSSSPYPLLLEDDCACALSSEEFACAACLSRALSPSLQARNLYIDMKMKRLIFLLCLLSAAVLRAQDARTLFVQMPDSVCPLLTEVNRADCIDFLDSRMRAIVTNRLGGKSEMTTLAPDYIRVQMTQKSTWQMKLLPAADSTLLVCTVSTVLGPAADSHIRFYTTDWHPLPADSLLPPLPAVNDYLEVIPDSAHTPRLRDALRQLNLRFLHANLVPGGDTLSLSLGTPAYMEKEAAEELKPFIRRTLHYVWQDGRFRPVR